MKLFQTILKFGLCLVAAIFLAEVVPAAEAAIHAIPALHALTGSGVVLGAVVSLVGLKNVAEQSANPAGGRRIFAILSSDLSDTVVDWPVVADITAHALTVAIPVKTGKTLAPIVPADNSLDGMFENQGDRYYQSFKHSVMFDIAGQSAAQLVEADKFVNAGCVFIIEENDGTMKVYGTKLQPIVLKQKGQLGKKGGDKRGLSFSGDNDNFQFSPPIYPSTLTLPLPA